MERGTPRGQEHLTYYRVKDTVVLHAKYEHGRGTLPSSVTKQFLSVIVSKDGAGATDRGRPIPSNFSVFFPYLIR